MLQLNLKLPDNILCFKLLGMHHSEIMKSRWFTLASDVKYESTELALKRISSLNVQSNSEMKRTLNKKSYYSQDDTTINLKKGKQNFNLSNKQGQSSRCAICDSKMQWAKHCPHRKKKI